MKKISLAILASLLMVFPVKVAAQEYDTPVVAPEIISLPDTTTVAEEAPAKPEKVKKEKKVKEKKVKEVKEKKAKGKLNDISKMLNSFVGKKINTEGLKSVTGQIKNALTDMTKAMDVVKTKMDATYYNQIETYASNVVIHFANGLSGKKNDKVISTACNTLLNSFANKLDINTGGKKYKSNFTTCANHIIAGFKVGLTSNTNMVGIYETGKKIYEKLDQGIRDAGQVKSPSRRTMEIGKYTVQGLLIGIKKFKTIF